MTRWRCNRVCLFLEENGSKRFCFISFEIRINLYKIYTKESSISAQVYQVYEVMDLVSDNFGYDVWEVDDIPCTSSSIWILGKSYKYEEIEEIRQKINSILWITYRKGFSAIGTSNHTSDKGKRQKFKLH